MEYPTYLIHYGIPGQKWGVRRYQNEDGTYTEEGKERRREEFIEETRKTAKKVAGIIAGHYGEKEISEQEMKKLVNKHKNFEYSDDYFSNLKKNDPEKYREYWRKYNKFDAFNKTADKLREWEDFENKIYKDANLLFWEKADRIDKLKEYMKKTDEEAEETESVKRINNKIENYLKAGEAYINSQYVKKQMKELNIKPEEIWDKGKEYSKGKEEGDRIQNLTKEYNKLVNEKSKLEGGSGRGRIIFEPESLDRRTYDKYVEDIIQKRIDKTKEDIEKLKKENKNIKINDIDEKLKKFRKQYNY